MLKGLFLNVNKAEDSIYESGLMIYNILKESTLYELEYTERTKPNLQFSEYDFYVWNYHFRNMGWLDTKRLPNGFNIAIVLEVLPNDPFVMIPHDFDAYCVLDPTMDIPDKRVYAFPRALENLSVPKYIERDFPVIGTFGFLTRGKGYDKVVEAVGKEFDRAVVRINIPYKGLIQEIKMRYLKWKIKRAKKGGISVWITHIYMNKQELVNWCAQNTLNIFLYDRDLPGLAATTDQCIISERPLAVSDNNTFRHITKYLYPYPLFSLKDSINMSKGTVQEIKKIWSKDKFRTRFEEVIYDHLRSEALQHK